MRIPLNWPEGAGFQPLARSLRRFADYATRDLVGSLRRFADFSSKWIGPPKKVTSELPTILALSEQHISNDLLTWEFRH
jgi:hypothetical protein